MKKFNMIFLAFFLSMLTLSFSAMGSCPDGSCSVKAAKEKKASCPKSACGVKSKGCDKKLLLKKLKYGPHINTATLRILLNSQVPLVLADARTGQWDDKMRIPGAISLSAKSTAKELEKAIPSKETLVITYCSSLKCPASQALYLHLKKHGYKHVLEYPFGIKAWLGSGYNVDLAS